jgi:hypothetical protein
MEAHIEHLQINVISFRVFFSNFRFVSLSVSKRHQFLITQLIYSGPKFASSPPSVLLNVLSSDQLSSSPVI